MANKHSAWLCVALFCLAIGVAQAQQRVPDHLKAAYIFNIARLVEWPTDVLPEIDTTIIFCTSAGDGVTQELRHLAQKQLGQRRVQVVALGARSEAHFCHLIFIEQDFTQIWFRHHDRNTPGQLIIGEDNALIELGGVINLYVDKERLRFEISLQNAQTLGIRISSRLLKLARIVDQPQVGTGDDD